MDIGLVDLLQGGIDLGNGIANAYADQSNANFIAQQFKFNSQISEIQGQEALEQGKFEQQLSQERTAQLSGQQQGAEAAQGVDVSTGTPAITRLQTGEIGGIDYATIGMNSYLKNLGYKIKGLNEKTQGEMEENAGKWKAGQDLLSGAQGLFQSGLKAWDYENHPTSLAG